MKKKTFKELSESMRYYPNHDGLSLVYSCLIRGAVTSEFHFNNCFPTHAGEDPHQADYDRAIEFIEKAIAK
jgi:hypothetical protein